MVAASNHGGGCCGARHIWGFGGAPDDVEELTRLTSERTLCLNEVILNKTQCEQYPHILTRLAELGYVLTTGFVNGNHDSSVYVFHRAGNRLPLNDLSFPWTGQIATPSLRGRIADFRYTVAGLARPTFRAGQYVNARNIRRGDRFTYHNPANELHGRTFTYSANEQPNEYAERIVLVDDLTGIRYKRAVSTLRWYTQAPAAAVPQAAPNVGTQRHDDDGDVPQNANRRIVHTTYHNVFRDGRVGPGYPSLEECRNGAPRASQRQIQHVYSDGSIETEILL